MTENHNTYITVYQAMFGWKSIMIWWNPEGFWEPYETGTYTYSSPQEAMVDAMEWAEVEGLEYIPAEQQKH